MNRLYTGIKELKAIDSIISDMESERISENNQQYQIALDTRDKNISCSSSFNRNICYIILSK